MDAVTAYGVEFPVSVWMKRVRATTPTPRVIVVIEPVERSSALFSLDGRGTIVSCDPWFACLFGFAGDEEVVGRGVAELVPSLHVPPNKASLSEVSYSVYYTFYIIVWPIIIVLCEFAFSELRIYLSPHVHVHVHILIRDTPQYV